ncbi:uncharacterized protein [Primulina eburnea]|uniref:uncharacterized protein isoform X2 n=1 Tax=Primulina eburnea TaxID=1245227 RepID=UPI003C6BDBCE
MRAGENPKPHTFALQEKCSGETMQGLHHHQQQLAALLAAALPKDDSSSAALAPTTATVTPASEEGESSRLSALTSLHRAVLYPPNSLLVAHSASYISKGFSQLISDKLYSVRLAAAKAYGALCSVLCSISVASNGRQNHVVLGSLIDQFIGWSLPSLNNTGGETSELALESLHEFLNVGDVGAVERYALPILKACQELIEDEKTSVSLLQRLLGVLTLISLKFFRCFQPHFVDIVDILLGWAMIPDIKESDKCVIMDSFLQFQKHWVNNMQFSLGLLSKFLGDMDVLLQDGGSGTPQQFKRILALLTCFCTVLQSVASGLLEINFLEQINESLCQMVPVLLQCLSLIGKKFGWSKWIEESWRCLTLLAEILSERFSSFYPMAVDTLFQSLEVENANKVLETETISTFQVHGILKTNLQLLSLQKLGLMSSSVLNILRFEGPISHLRLHPNHLVTGSAAATYIFLLQHGKNDVVEKTMDSLIEELQLLTCKLEQISIMVDELDVMAGSKCYSKSELVVLIKFNMKVLLSCVTFGPGSSLIGQTDVDTLCVSRAHKLVTFVSSKMDPFSSPIQNSVELQVTILKTLERLTAIELVSKYSMSKQKTSSGKYAEGEIVRNSCPTIVFDPLRRCSKLLIKSLCVISPFTVKIEAIKWVHKFCENVIEVYKNIEAPLYPCQVAACWKIIHGLLLSILAAASDKEPKVRYLVAAAVEMLLIAKLIHPLHFPVIAEVFLEKLGDPETHIKNTYLKQLSHVLPVTTYTCDLHDFGLISTNCSRVHTLSDHSVHWKQLFALKQMPQKLHSHQLVSILSYISQRWQVPLASWIHRLIYSCYSKRDPSLTQQEDVDVDNGLWWDIKVEEDTLERICTVNHLAGAWWAIHEAARFCITTRLRTNLGGPTQTFAALERMLLDIAHVLRLETDQNDGNFNVIGSCAHLLPMRLFLEFVEALKKNVYNAYEGSTILSHASRQSLLFFRANKKVCEEWFSRISEPMMDAGLKLQCHDATIHYCSLRLVDISNFVALALSDNSKVQASENLQNIRGRYAGDILRILRNMTFALCKKREPEVLIGIQKWATISFSPLFKEDGSSDGMNLEFSWITGLVYQARGEHEKAAAHYIHLLQTEESLSSMGSDGVQFAIARIIESYTAISDWKSLESWLLELQTIRAKYAGKSYAGALTTAGNEINSIQALACFDEGNFQAAWSFLDLTPKSSNELTLDPKLALQRSEQMLLQAMLLHVEGKADEVCHELQRAKSLMEETFSVLALDGLVDAAPHVNQLYCISAFEESCKPGDNQGKHVTSLLNSYIQTGQFPCGGVYQDCSLWLKVLRVHQTTLPTAPVTLELCKNLMILARKQRNLRLATRLSNYLKSHVSLCFHDGLHEYFTSILEYEAILAMRAENKEEALTYLWSFVRPFLVDSSIVPSDSRVSVLKANACLKLSKWLIRDYAHKSLENVVLKMRADFIMTEITSGNGSASLGDGYQSSKSRVNLIVEELAGTATKLSTLLCPTMGKSWILYASWCYVQARASVSSDCEMALHSCSFSPILASEIQHQRFVLTEEEQLRVKNIILEHTLNRSDEKMYEERGDYDSLETGYSQNESNSKVLLQKIIDAIETAAGTPGAEDNDIGSLSAALAIQLQKCFSSSTTVLEDAEVMSLVHYLVEVWWSLRRRRVSLFGHAAQAFINYLSYSSMKCSNGQLSSCDVESNYKYPSHTLRAILNVLHIIVNYGVELKDTIEPALSKVPLPPLEEITPQLFARLSSHPNEVVRKQLENLLITRAKLSPWSLVYPTLVDVNSQEKEPSEEIQKILAYLNKLYPRLVQDAHLMIKELENVTVLWEELWLGTLQDLHSDVMRRINLLKEDAARIAENSTLSHGEKNKINGAKYSAMMAPVFVVLERRLTSTSRKPETPHEARFLEEYQETIKLAFAKFKTPPASVVAIGDVWRPFENIAASLASYQRKSSVSLGEVSPLLASLSTSYAPMPGLEKEATISEPESDLDSISPGIVTISSFSAQVSILPTKTKPKKIVIMGSDGMNYTYLLKGREDLRLDARIMQLLQAVNRVLQSSAATRGQPLGIRYYSVTPISGRAGLIQWVDNLISIYSVFKSWQNRAQLSQLSAMGTDTKTTAPPVARPSDLFYGKIIPALKEKGIRRVISRRDWPHEVKRKVLLELMKETPKHLLYQELWCASEGFQAFNSKLKRYSGSVAAMSIVGHILGLGDRHLDNILVDFCRGDIVHIDYNVCFDKGQRLKIPEIVPFRLTQTVEAALGLTGMEGSFRANCEAVLSVLRKNKDIILMLLEVFVWDPLVEWTRANFHDDAAVVGEERRGMELAVSLSLFASRVQEIRIPLQEHHDLLLSTLPDIEVALERFFDALNQYEIVSGLFYCADQDRSTLVLHESSAKLAAAEATSNSEKTLALFEMHALEFAQAQAIVMEKGREAATWIEQHGMILDALRGSSIPEIKACIKLTGSGEALSLTSAVLVSGVPLTVVPEPTQIQCHDIDREISHLVTELDYGLSSAVAALQMYSLALQRILPLNYLITSQVHGWAQVMLSLNTLSPDIISVALRQGVELVTKGHNNGTLSVKSSYDDLCLKLMNHTADIERLEEDCSEITISIGQGTESKAKERLLSTFVNHIQHSGLKRRQEAFIPERTLISAFHGDIEEKRESMLSILNKVLYNLFTDVKHRISRSQDNSAVARNTNTGLSSYFGSFPGDFEEQIEKCALVAEFLEELKCHVGLDVHDTEANANISSYTSQESWASLFKTNLLFCKNFVRNMIEVVVPSVIKSAISFNSDVMDIFGSISQIRGSIETSLEQFIQVQLEKSSLIELEQNYFVKVGLITEQQLALEEAAVKGRDHLSWEEAEELASQEEACRVQLDKLHQMWNQKDLRNSLLMKKEASITSALISTEHQLKSLIGSESEMEPHVLRKKGLLTVLTESFSELESIDQALISTVGPICHSSHRIPYLAEMMNSGHAISEYIWKFPSLPSNFSFLIWKVSVVDLLLDSCTHDVATSFDQNLGFEQHVDLVKKALSDQLQERISRYLKERVVPLMLTRLDTEIEMLREKVESSKDRTIDQIKIDHDAVGRVQFMLEEYCNAHETVRAAISAASIMKKQVNELKDALIKTNLEICQMEWIYDISSSPLKSTPMISQKFIGGDDNLLSVILNISRSKLLEKLQSSVTKIARSLERLQSCEGTSIATEGQLERAMSWACGGPNSSPAGNSGIPLEFHDHLINRRQLLQGARENASEVMKVCTSILEFEASRHGIFRTKDGGIWEQSYLNALKNLDVTYHSFTRSEQEWKQAQSNMEAASSGLVSASNELHVAALKAKSASGDMQSTLLAMRDSACELSVALSAYSGIIRGHSTLTSECGPMLEEVLAITEALHDVHSLGKEAAVLHSSIMQNLSKANAILLPLESLLSKDVAAMTDAMAREKETNVEIAPIHGQAIFQSYHNRIKEALLGFKPLVPALVLSVEELYSKLIKLARAAGLHAGNLHKALEGLGESLQVRSQDIGPSREDLSNHAIVYDTQESGKFSKSNSEFDSGSVSLNELCLPDRGWISPPESIDNGSTESGFTSAEASLADSFSGLDITELLSGDSDSKENGGYPHCMPSLLTEVQDLPLEKAEAKILLQESSDLVREDKAILLNQDKAEEESRGTSFTDMRTVDQARGKNAYAMSVLRRVEMKLDGRDITETRDITVAEQVDFLLRQATNIDNLCNMYEGWTPWI